MPLSLPRNSFAHSYIPRTLKTGLLYDLPQFNVERTQFDDRVELARKEANIAAKETVKTEMAILDNYNKALKNNIVERGTSTANARRVRIVLMELR